MDEEAVASSITTILPSFNTLCIKDCYRLGRYVQDSPHPRPILVELIYANDVLQILSKRFSLPPSSHFSIKPDLSLEERKSLSLLLAERRNLIDNSNHDKRLIKIRTSCIYINERLHARVVNGVIQLSHTLADHFPPSFVNPDSSPDSSDDTSVSDPPDNSEVTNPQ